MMKAARHILSLSGGKDSAALAVYMRDRISNMEYVFHDSGKELPETYDYLARLESVLGKPIVKSSSRDSFDHWLKMYGDMIPSDHRRWCTKMLKLKPFESYVGDDPVLNYVGLRADEDRDGYISHKANITSVYPFREDGLVRADIVRILEESGVGLPSYTTWGRTRSGCFFCFYQQRIEWVRLKDVHPDLFEQAKVYEEKSIAKGSPFYWNANESLAELEQPERMAEIRRKWEESQARKRANVPKRRLLQILVEAPEDDEEPEEPEGCLICSI